MKTILDLLFGIFCARSEAKSLSYSVKGQRTVKYTVLSVLDSLLGVGMAYLTAAFAQSLGETEGVAAVAAFPLVGLFAVICGLGSLLFFANSLNNVACQRIVNRKAVRFLALLINFACFGVSLYIVTSAL